MNKKEVSNKAVKLLLNITFYFPNDLKRAFKKVKKNPVTYWVGGKNTNLH